MGPSWTEIQKFSLIDMVQETKNGFGQISQLTVLGHMLLYNLYINVLIALVLQYQDSP